MVPVIETAENNEFRCHPRKGGGGQSGQQPQEKGIGTGGHGGPHIGPYHIKGPMGQVDHLHDSENQGQTGGHEKKGDTQLEAVENLFNNEKHNNKGSPGCYPKAAGSSFFYILHSDT